MENQILKKEDLANVHFTVNEAFSDVTKKKHLMSDLIRAQSLGNLEKTKVKITFHLQDGGKGEVETTVWGVGEHHLMLKGGIHIPIRAIESVNTI
ncbi:hypothetical protein [Marivirga harenae]|uniref:hypothetical protein n=1 Tax=Marivirga harenae TaxID=2010992 RepID=UPI0026E10856|nr:hypothetical protein [Marivirga harenae]WKV12098.1 hypothetical protein Q3Y49_18030 [Marivirga harenae]|tara:strand:+ start:210647 stop:210931 length:285 start_codon:yes stop_codon:yes gene_type:complete